MTPYRHSPTTRAVLRSLVPVICPPEAAPLADAIVDHMAPGLASLPAVMARGLAAGIAAYDLGALPRYRRRARALTGDRAEAYFASWEHGPTPVHVQLARALNQLMSLSCYEQPAMMERLGYRPAPWIAEVTQRRLTVYAGDVRRQAAQVIAPDPLRPGVTLQRSARPW
ncbi:MAG TPA: hypothetical protein VFP84_34065 [Kofleriaceae bacterium]|nr:hypothetical protein [Kofleriaceae bacterium]